MRMERKLGIWACWVIATVILVPVIVVAIVVAMSVLFKYLASHMSP